MKSERYLATSQDRMQFTTRYVCDQQLHVIMEFSDRLDGDRVKKATRLLLMAEPILACRFIDVAFPYWQRREKLDSLPDFLLVDCSEPRAEAEAFAIMPSDPTVDPLVMVRLFRAERTDTLCIKTNHVVADGTGARSISYSLADIYSHLGPDADHQPRQVKDLDRRMYPIWKKFPFVQRMGMLRKAVQSMRRRTEPSETIWAVPFSSREHEGRRQLIARFDRDRSSRIATYVKDKGATIDDVFLTAFVMSAHALIQPKEGVEVPFQVAFDLRQYSPGEGAEVANLISAIFFDLARRDGEDLETMLPQVKAMMERAKSEHRAALSIPIINLRYGLWGYRMAKRSFEEEYDMMVKRRFVRPSFANLGILEPERLRFDGQVPIEAYITSPITYPPLLIIGLSGYRDTLTLTLGFSEYGVDIGLMERMLDLMDRYLPP
jgi:NRPS condensation-like uncharacterized protein